MTEQHPLFANFGSLSGTFVAIPVSVHYLSIPILKKPKIALRTGLKIVEYVL